MKNRSRTWIQVIPALALLLGGVSLAYADGKGAAALAQGGAENKTTFLVFFRGWDAPTQSVAQAVKATADKYAAKATWTAVGITDPAEKAIVDRYQLSRAPMPLVLAVHANGVVTGAFQKPPTETDLVDAMVTAKKAECMKLLQQNQLVLVCVQPPGQNALPQGVRDFQADPQFANRSKVVTLPTTDASEATFFGHLQVDAQTSTPLTVFLAPPGVMVGKFPVTATKADFAGALHKAGKCCDDKNCKHNH